MVDVSQTTLSQENYLETEVIILGNGPAGLSLSAFLSGWTPYYDPESPHPNPVVHQNLVDQSNTSLLEQDLSWLEGVMDEYGVHGISVLYDSLARPDRGSERTNTSMLRWQLESQKAIPHVVIGETSIGGAWNSYDDEMITLSNSRFLDLPALSIGDWLEKKNLSVRLPTVVVREYFKAYAKKIGIYKHILCGIRVTNSIKRCDQDTGKEFWELHALNAGEPLVMRCNKLVLACGKNNAKILETDGDVEQCRVVSDVSALRARLSILSVEQYEKVVIIGDGISAADAVIHCLKANIPVLHVMRRSDKQLRYLQLSRLSVSIYPEYAQVYQLMTGKAIDPLYRRITGSSLFSFTNGVVVIRTPDGFIQETCEVICSCVGKCSELSFLDEKYEFNTYLCVSDQSLFQIGSMAGDHFVRYITGGSLLVARLLLSF